MPFSRRSIAIAHQHPARLAIHVGEPGFEDTGLLTARGVAGTYPRLRTDLKLCSNNPVSPDNRVALGILGTSGLFRTSTGAEFA